MSKCNHCNQELDKDLSDRGVGLCEPCEVQLHSSMGISAKEIAKMKENK